MFSGIMNKLLGRNAGSSPVPEKKIPFVIREDDVFIVSYPKSGNTWARFLIGNYITDGNFSFLNSNDYIPDMHAHPEKCAAMAGPRIIKSHFSFRPELRRVIYIVRDPRDVAVSYYYYYLKYVYNNMPVKPDFQEFFESFIQGKVEFGLWDRHAMSWCQPGQKDFLLLRYEDMIADAAGALQQMLVFLYGDFDKDKVQKAVEASRFERMAEQERQQRAKLPRNAASDSSIPFVRKGSPGNFTEYLSEKNVDEIRAKFGSAMKIFNY